MFKIGLKYHVETGQKTGGIGCYTGVLSHVEEVGEYNKLTFERGAFIYYARRDGKWTRHGWVFQSVDTQGQDIRLSDADLIGDQPFGIKPGLKLTVNWTRKGIAPALMWRGLRNGNWEEGNGLRTTKGVGRRASQKVRG
jgi:hypothetical protein